MSRTTDRAESVVHVEGRSGGPRPHSKVVKVVELEDGRYRVRLSNGRTVIARRTGSGQYVVVKNVVETARKKHKRVPRLTPTQKKVPAAADDASYRELEAILGMEDTGRSRRGVR